MKEERKYAIEWITKSEDPASDTESDGLGNGKKVDLWWKLANSHPVVGKIQVITKLAIRQGAELKKQ